MLTNEQWKMVTDNTGLMGLLSRKYPGEDELDACLSGLIRAAGKFDPGRKVKFSTFAVYCMWRELLNMWRKTKHRPSTFFVDSEDLDHQTRSRDPSSLKELADRDHCNVLLSKLKRADRKMVELYYYHGWTMQQLSVLFGITKAGVSFRLRRSREKMRRGPSGE